MWPFPKINKPEPMLQDISDKLHNVTSYLQAIDRVGERHYENICRVLDIIVLESRAHNKSFTEAMQKRMTELEIDSHKTSEEGLTTAQILADAQLRIIQLENKIKEDKLLS